MATIYYDRFKITAPDNVGMRACLLIDEPMKPDGDMSTLTINEGKHSIAHQEIDLNEFERVWTELFMWMNTNGYNRRNEPPLKSITMIVIHILKRSLLWIYIFLWSKNKKSVLTFSKNKC